MTLIRHNARVYRKLVGVAAMLHMMQAAALDIEDGKVNNDSNRGRLRDQLNTIRSDQTSFDGRDIINCQIDRALEALTIGSAHEWAAAVREVAQRVEDAMEGQRVYIISPDARAGFENPVATWGSAPVAFPSALDDLEEAEKSLALGLNTACVFHCMGVMHRGLIVLATDLGRTVNHLTDTWEMIISAIDAGVKAKQNSLARSDWKLLEPFYEEAVSDLRSAKNAWRNPTMHFTRTYSADHAHKVKDRVRDFMVHLATRLHE